METLRFFGLQPRMTVVEFWPGSGWWTEILAPYLAEGAGKYVAAGFQTGPLTDPAQSQLMAAFEQRFTTDKRLYGEIILSAFGPTSGPVAEAGTAGEEAVEAAAEQLGISRRQVYVLLRRWREGQGVVSDLIPGRSSGGRGGQRQRRRRGRYIDQPLTAAGPVRSRV